MAFGKRRKGNAQKVPSLPSSGHCFNTDFRQIELHNVHFESYYKDLIIPEEEWEDFIGRMREPLPVTFRLPASPMAGALEEYLGKEFSFLERIGWYPTPGSAWKVAAGRTQVRREAHYAKLHGLLVRETEVGNICRQEAVSMIPPLFLGVLPGDTVLDMCAAPGSKTCQLVEMMRSTSSIETPEGQLSPNVQGLLPVGVVVANDVDMDRASMMVHQVKRMHSPSLVVTTVDAARFPTSHQFERILCDVPCSGDGTLRKNKLIWRTWRERDAEALQPLQIAILDRGLSLLRRGGRLVYSTCSMNPIENEGVIAAILEKHQAEFSLVDCSKDLPDLKRRPGLLKGAPEFAMERCMRFYPHLQDTGGFFVAVIERNLSAPAELASSEISANVDPKLTSEVASFSKANPGSIPLKDAIDIALDQWGLKGETAAPLSDLLITRKVQEGNDHPQKLLPHLSLLSSKAKGFVDAWAAKGIDHLVLYAGLATFARQDSNDSYRIKYPALPYLLPFMDASRILRVDDPSDIRLLLMDGAPSNANDNAIDHSTDDATHHSTETTTCDVKSQSVAYVDEDSQLESGLNKLPRQDAPQVVAKETSGNKAVRMEMLSPILQQELELLTIGCHVAQIVSGMNRVTVPLWRGRSSVHLLVGKMDKASLYFLWSISVTV